MTLDISIRHFYNEVKIVYILSDDYTSKMQWIRWLQNVDNRKIGVKNIVCDEESKNIILEDMYITLSARESAATVNKDIVFPEHYVVLLQMHLPSALILFLSILKIAQHMVSLLYSLKNMRKCCLRGVLKLLEFRILSLA